MAYAVTTARVPAGVADFTFATERSVLLLLTGDQRLLSFDVRSDAEPRLEWRARDGHVLLAAGWLEDGVAVMSAGPGMLDLTHAELDPEGGPSRAARVTLAGTGLELGDLRARRLEPYVRWWQEVNPVEEALGTVALVRDARARLHYVSTWRDGAQQRAHVGLVAEEVTALSGCDERHVAVFSGVVRGSAGIFTLDRRSPEPILEQRLTGRPRGAYFAWPRATAGMAAGALQAIELAPNVWEVGAAQPSVTLMSEERAVGLTIRPGTDDPALVVLSPDRHELCLAADGRREPVFRAAAAIEHVAVHPAQPLFAVNVGDELSLVSRAEP